MTLTVEEKKIRFPVDLTPANDVLADFLVIKDSVTDAYTFATRLIDADNNPILPMDLADDAAFTPATSKVLPIGFFADESTPDSVNEGDIGAARMTLDRHIRAVVHEESNELRIGGVAVTVKFAAISVSSSGDNTILAAVTSKKIRVLSYSLMAAGAVNARFQTAAAGAYLTGLKYFAAAGAGIVAPYNPKGWFETVAGDLLNLELSGAVAVGGEFSYIEV